MTMMQASGEREPMRPSTSDCACAREAEAAVLLGDEHAEEAVLLDEAPDLGGDLAVVVADLPVVDHPAELVAVGPSRNAFSSSVSVMGGTARSFSQSGVPENSSASKPMVPALSASCSVAETLGRMPLILWKIGRVSAARRMAGTDSPASTITGSQASTPRGPTSTSYSPCSMPDCQT